MSSNGKYFYAHEVAKLIGGGLTSWRVGRIANLNKLKIEKYGIWVEDAVVASNGRISHRSVFKYNKAGVKVIKRIWKNANS
jgi:hypothetical protein